MYTKYIDAAQIPDAKVLNTIKKKNKNHHNVTASLKLVT